MTTHDPEATKSAPDLTRDGDSAESIRMQLGSLRAQICEAIATADGSKSDLIALGVYQRMATNAVESLNDIEERMRELVLEIAGRLLLFHALHVNPTETVNQITNVLSGKDMDLTVFKESLQAMVKAGEKDGN